MAEDHLAAPRGCYPPAPAAAGRSAKGSVLLRGSLRGMARHGYEIPDDDHSLNIPFSPDAEGWSDALTGVYRRIN